MKEKKDEFILRAHDLERSKYKFKKSTLVGAPRLSQMEEDAQALFTEAIEKVKVKDYVELEKIKMRLQKIEKDSPGTAKGLLKRINDTLQNYYS